MIIQIGPYPPPYGGISIYIKRLKLVLDDNKLENQVWNIFSNESGGDIKSIKLRNLHNNIIKSPNSKILHYNISGIIGKNFIYIINKTVGRKKKNIMTLHGDSKDLFDKNKFLMRMTLNSFDSLICVKAGDKEYLESMDIKVPIYEIPAYINPNMTKTDEDNIPKDVQNFMESDKFIVAANGSITFNRGEDLYGLDLLVDLMIRVSDKNIKLIFCVLSVSMQNEKEKEYYKKIKIKIKENNLLDNILLYEANNTEFYPILKQSNLFIRPTNTDGDAVSIREALYFNVPCISSNVVTRPDGTILFENRNSDDLYNKFNYVLENYEENVKKVKKVKIEDNSDKILEIYNKFLEVE